jgi:spore coat protein H
MLRCELDLGQRPWDRLAEGRVEGSIRWNGGRRLWVKCRIRGAHSRKFPRKSLQVDLAGQPLPDEPPSGHTVRRIHLNADYIDPTRMRSALSYALFSMAGAPAPLCRHAALTVSGEPMGLYMALESVDSDFCRRRGWKPGAIFYAVSRNANFGLISPNTRMLKQPLDQGYQAVADADPTPVRRMLTEINLASDRSFPAAVERWMDVDGYLTWLMVAVYVGNRDGFMHNYALCRSEETGQFRIIPWDYDATWGIDIHGRPARLDRVPVTGWNRLTGRLMALGRYRSRYRDMFMAALNDGPLAPGSVLPLIDKMSAEVEAHFDTSRHRSDREVGFDRAVDELRWWARERRALLLKELADL